MSAKRTYGDACGMARALDRVGERWALMLVRELLMGPKRFTDLRVSLPGVSADVLTQRLRDLEQAGVLVKRRLPPPAASQVYALTAWGRELEDVCMALGRWGARAPLSPAGVGMSVDSHLISLRTLFDPERAGDLELVLELRFGDERFDVTVADGRLDVARGAVTGADVTVTSDPGTFLAILHGRLTLGAAERAGDLQLTGDRRAFARFARVFPLPEPADVPATG